MCDVMWQEYPAVSVTNRWERSAASCLQMQEGAPAVWLWSGKCVKCCIMLLLSKCSQTVDKLCFLTEDSTLNSCLLDYPVVARCCYLDMDTSTYCYWVLPLWHNDVGCFDSVVIFGKICWHSNLIWASVHLRQNFSSLAVLFVNVNKYSSTINWRI